MNDYEQQKENKKIFSSNVETLDEYSTQAQQFLKDTQTTFKAEFVKHDKHFNDDKVKRDIYKVTFERGNRSFKVMFGQSINESLTPEYRELIKNNKQQLLKRYPLAYDVLVCLQKYDVGTFKDFCSDFDYNDDSIKAHKTYKAVCDEYKNVCSLWSEAELEMLQEIN